jgi:hypothetical protein
MSRRSADFSEIATSTSKRMILSLRISRKRSIDSSMKKDKPRLPKSWKPQLLRVSQQEK